MSDLSRMRQGDNGTANLGSNQRLRAGRTIPRGQFQGSKTTVDTCYKD